jgi:hypothetical protein
MQDNLLIKIINKISQENSLQDFLFLILFHTIAGKQSKFNFIFRNIN